MGVITYIAMLVGVMIVPNHVSGKEFIDRFYSDKEGLLMDMMEGRIEVAPTDFFRKCRIRWQWWLPAIEEIWVVSDGEREVHIL